MAPAKPLRLPKALRPGQRNYRYKKEKMARDPAYLEKHRRQNREAVYRTFDRKRAIIAERKGDACSNCGRTFPKEHLHFHHVDPATKKFSLANGYLEKWDAIEDELKKVVVLCEQCHCEVHHPRTEESSESHCEGTQYVATPENTIASPSRSGHRRTRINSPVA
jgi:hypothetical protein